LHCQHKGDVDENYNLLRSVIIFINVPKSARLFIAIAKRREVIYPYLKVPRGDYLGSGLPAEDREASMFFQFFFGIQPAFFLLAREL